jgi:Fe-S cluster biogenesis protein NfuA
MTEKIEAVIKEIKSSLRSRYEDVELIGVTKSGIVKVKLTGEYGACRICHVTLLYVIEKILKQTVPGVEGVISV